MQSDAPPEEVAAAISKISDSISKITKTIRSLYKDHDRLESILFAIKELIDFIRLEADASTLPEEFFQSLGTLLDKFKTYVINKYGK